MNEARMLAEYLMRYPTTPLYQVYAKFGIDQHQAQKIMDMRRTAFGPGGKGLEWYVQFIEKILKGKTAMDRTMVASELVKIAKLLSADDVAKGHKKAIAIKTLKMNDVMARIMGGMSKEEAREFLKSIGYSDAQIKKLES